MVEAGCITVCLCGVCLSSTTVRQGERGGVLSSDPVLPYGTSAAVHTEWRRVNRNDRGGCDKACDQQTGEAVRRMLERASHTAGPSFAGGRSADHNARASSMALRRSCPKAGSPRK